MPIERIPVESSNIKAVGYDADSRTLVVEFKNGGLHQYFGVSPEAHGDFVGAKSVGSHFHKHIRGVFESERIEEKTEDEANG